MVPPETSPEREAVLAAAAGGRLDAFRAAAAALDGDVGSLRQKDTGASCLHLAAAGGHADLAVHLLDDARCCEVDAQDGELVRLEPAAATHMPCAAAAAAASRRRRLLLDASPLP